MKISVCVSGVTTKIPNGNVQNTSQKHNGLSQLTQNIVWAEDHRLIYDELNPT